MDPPPDTSSKPPPPPVSAGDHRPRGRTPSEEGPSPAASSNLWVGNLSPDTTERDLGALFGKYGELESVSAYTPRNNYAFVHFRRLDDAKLARDTLQGALVRGSPIKIDFAKPARPSKHLWVGGISPTLTREQLKEEFLKFGEIEDLKLIKDRNSALVEYYKIEDAAEALKNLNGKSLGGEQIKVDFVRSHPGRRDFPDHDPWMPPESMRSFTDSSQHGIKRPLLQGGHKEGPSKILWIRYPPSVLIDEQMLHNAMILFGEIERIKSFPGKRHAFVEFRSVDEARRAKEGLQGRLFNDPRIQIMYSYSGFAPLKDGPPFFPGRGPRPDMFYNEPFFGADMFPPGPFPNNFPGPPHPNPVMKPFPPQGFDPIHGAPDFSDSWRRSPPPLPGMLPSAPGMRPHFRPPQGPWADFDARDPKRSRLEGPGFIDDIPFHARGGDPYGSPQLDRNAAGPPLRSPVRTMGPVVGGPAGFEPHGVPHREHCWRGLIAKGGTPVCHARCIAIGKGISSILPEVVNCSARTGLDMLSKHYAEANGFDIVFFLPDSEEDFASYTEFLRYLGAKNRAGVVKLDDGTTLFLVPPSDFLWNVLNVSGPERLYGVVLKLSQPPLSTTVQPPEDVATPAAQYTDRRPPPHTSYGLASRNEENLRAENNQGPHEESMPHVSGAKPPLPHAEESHTAPPVSLSHSANPAVSNVEVSLTPELLATLASLVPANVQSSSTGTVQLPLNSSMGSHSFAAPAIPDKATSSQGWVQDHQALVGPVQQGQITHPPIQLGPQPSNQATISQFPNYGSAINPSEISAQMFPGSVEAQVPTLNMQHVTELPAGLMGNYAYPAQGTNYPVTPQNQQYQLNNVYASNTSNYGMAQTSDVGGVMNQLVQQTTPSTSVPNQGWPLPQPQGVMPPMNDNVKPEFPNQLQQLQAALSSSAQGAAASEADKNQRYQSTLQFAASLLMQIQQQQQQGSAQSAQGSGKPQ